jgi:hypothetical protein
MSVRRTLECVFAAVVPLPVLAQDVGELPGLSACRALLQVLDGAWNEGDADGYLRHFEVEQPLVQDLHERRTRERLGCTSRLQRTSEPGKSRRVGEHVVLQVRYETRCDGAALPPLREGGLLVLRQQHEKLQPVLAVDLPAIDCADDDVFVCPPCNYRMGGAPGWLCVPIAPERAAAFDGATFLLLGTAIALEITVEVGDVVAPATAVVERLAAELRRHVVGATASVVEPWQPPGIPAGAAQLGGARASVDLPDGDRVVLHAGVLGRLRHLLLLRGPAQALQQDGARIDALLATYELCTTETTPGQHAVKAIAAHTGGTLLENGEYRNDRHGVAATGPHGWRGSERCSGARFQVVWSCPRGHGRMWLSGYSTPLGIERWTAKLADRWLEDHCKRGGLSLGKDEGWQPAADGSSHERHLEATSAAGPRRLHLMLKDDLLVVADAGTSDSGCDEKVAAALASVRWLR